MATMKKITGKFFSKIDWIVILYPYGYRVHWYARGILRDGAIGSTAAEAAGDMVFRNVRLS